MLENYNELTIHEHMIEDLQEKIDALMVENDLLKERIDELELKNIKLKRLLLLTDDVVSDVAMGDTQLKQWNEFIKEFPDEDKEQDN